MARFSPRSSGLGIGRALRSLGRELPGVAPAVVVIALLVCLLLPLPTALLDLLLSLSLAAAVILLVAGLRIPRAAEFTSFPTLVLLSTLYRLALNVSTTRLILSQADAGRVIDAFASLVVRGDLLIGAVMFGVITAIQYLVIARGAERVAEVAARFTLDGMPGQQQAIDADLRSGAIGPREAQARRAALGERADFFGRMDGVMRWVKGDAIVGLLIMGINLIGGLAVGAARNGLGIGESLALYGKLAIGDGLLAQLPALLIALAAALLVARVDREREQQALAWLSPAMLLVPAGLLGLLALVPGMPTLAFATTAAGLIAAALVIAGHDHEERSSELVIRVRVGCDPTAHSPLARALADLRRRCEDALAIAVPKLVLETGGGPALARGELELRYGERVLGRSQVGDGHEPRKHEGGAELDALVLGTFQVLMRSAEALISLEDIEAELERCRRRHPSVVRQVMRTLEPVDLLAIVRTFVRERIPVPSMDALVRVLAEQRVFRDPAERARWPEHAREALADHWVRDLCESVAELGSPRWIRASVDLEDAILARSVAGDAGVSLGLSPPERERICARVRALAGGAPAIVLCSSRARPALARVLAGGRPHVPVLSLGELIAADLELPATRCLDLE
ncbi:MAG: FHIPEP family type III secretion protein [Enhygromyxa sp.]